jgi:hypothetical protein
MTDPEPNLLGKGIRPEALGRTVANFLIAMLAGLVSVFLPRMLLLLSVDTEPAPQRYISVFQPDFVWLGLAFGLAIGIICAILEYGAEQEPRAVFMTALGIPALLSGVFNTTSATNKLQKVEQEKVAIIRAVSDQAGIPQERSHSWEPLGSSPGGSESPNSSSALDPFFIFVEPAFAQSPLRTAQQPARFDPGIQIQRPTYVLALKRASSQKEAVRMAKELQKDVPTAQAVKTDQGFLVVDSLTRRSEADALLDAIQLKSRKKFNPSLLQVPE